MLGTVLVVDDDPEILNFLSTLLELEGIETRLATNAAIALTLLRHDPLPSLVLLDIAMPDRDGLDLCRAIKADPRTSAIPVFVVSARPGNEVMERARESGAERFVRKPFENAEMVELIRSRLQG